MFVRTRRHTLFLPSVSFLPTLRLLSLRLSLPLLYLISQRYCLSHLPLPTVAGSSFLSGQRRDPWPYGPRPQYGGCKVVDSRSGVEGLNSKIAMVRRPIAFKSRGVRRPRWPAPSSVTSVVCGFDALVDGLGLRFKSLLFRFPPPCRLLDSAKLFSAAREAAHSNISTAFRWTARPRRRCTPAELHAILRTKLPHDLVRMVRFTQSEVSGALRPLSPSSGCFLPADMDRRF